MSGWAGRIVFVSSFGLTACAAIAGLRDPIENDPPATEEREDARPDVGSSSGGDHDGEPAADAFVDALDVSAPACPRKPNGVGCRTRDECCSERCNEAALCAQDCRGAAEGCNPLDEAPCCVGYYCAGLLCGLCIGPGGNPAPLLSGGANVKSCCSRAVDEETKKCK